jgi:hypothetical protein
METHQTVLSTQGYQIEPEKKRGQAHLPNPEISIGIFNDVDGAFQPGSNVQL